MHGLRWRRGRDDYEHGAIGMMLAVLLSGGVLFGMGAVVVDVGHLYVEREELQSGADAASWKIGLTCASDATKCTSALQSPVATSYAEKNARDHLANAQICLSSSPATCPATWQTPAACPTLSAPATGYSNGTYVEVRTSTLAAAGKTVIAPLFARATKGSAYAGKRVGACARVSWGPPAHTSVFALGISLCDWKRMTGNGVTYYGLLDPLLQDIGLFNILGLTPPVSGVDSAIPEGGGILAFTTNKPATSCTTPINVNDPRGYAWLRDTAGNLPSTPDCLVDLNVGDWARSFSILSAFVWNQNCKQKLHDYAGKKTLLVPIYDAMSQVPPATSASYHIVGFAPFVVTGYNGNMGPIGSILNSLFTANNIFKLLTDVLCGLVAGTGCVYGYFTKSLVTQSNPQFGTGTNYGATIIGRTG